MAGAEEEEKEAKNAGMTGETAAVIKQCIV
jgi:hypothetical protein